ncbi:MAG TPA: hypothetical protein VI320_06375 [Terracidiphilus sp.]|jgi:hypothetical protein
MRRFRLARAGREQRGKDWAAGFGFHAGRDGADLLKLRLTGKRFEVEIPLSPGWTQSGAVNQVGGNGGRHQARQSLGGAPMDEIDGGGNE